MWNANNETDEQLAVLRGNLESEYFGSMEEALKAYNALQGKFQSLVREFYRKDAEFRDVSNQLISQVEALGQENHRISMDNAALRERNLDLALRLENAECKRHQGNQCLPTTFIQRLLREPHGMRIAVLQNEYSSEMGIEKPILSAGGAPVYELPNGCLCCSIKDGIIDAVETILQHRDDIEWLVVEAAGSADPVELVSEFWLDDNSRLVLDGVLSITSPSVLRVVTDDDGEIELPQANGVASENYDTRTPIRFDEDSPTLSNGTALASMSTSRASLYQRFKLLGRDTLDGINIRDLMCKQLSVADVIIINKIDQEGPELGFATLESGAVGAASEAENGSAGTFPIFDGLKAMLKDVNPSAKVLTANFCNVQWEDVMNLKMFDTSRIMKYLPETGHDDDGSNEHSHNHDSSHHSSLTNVFVKSKGAYSLKYINDYVSHLLWLSGTPVYRCKGIFLARKNCPSVTVPDDVLAIFQLQGVGMMFEINETELDELSENRFLFVGKDLDVETIKLSLQLSS
ncbi:cobalamin synthesis protein [Babesia caballi]|uniref:Cobalamin synthesis protein n=1 Tax=Babesia caballi TaxID=5871 RepID=A0AAV4LQG5_BABCB|nr:cobalamin synthesis protein [Babesia caballi]